MALDENYFDAFKTLGQGLTSVENTLNTRTTF